MNMNATDRRFLPKNPLWRTLAVLALVVLLAFLLGLVWCLSEYAFFATGFLAISFLLTGNVIMCVVSKKMTTRTARVVPYALTLLLAIGVFLFAALGAGVMRALVGNAGLHPVEAWLFTSIFAVAMGGLAFILAAPWRAFSLPSSLWLMVGLWWLLGAAGDLAGEAKTPYAGLFLILAGNLFPMHRRLKVYWRPTRLPRLRPCTALPSIGRGEGRKP